jgi:hypothetical protein
LEKWKQHSESLAARESSATQDVIGDLINRIDLTVTKIYEFAESWEQKERWWHRPYKPNMSEEERSELWQQQTQELIAASNARHSAYHSEIVPLTTDILIRAELILGSDNEHMVKASQAAWSAPTNYHSIREMAERLLALKTVLQLR